MLASLSFLENSDGGSSLLHGQMNLGLVSTWQVESPQVQLPDCFKYNYYGCCQRCCYCQHHCRKDEEGDVIPADQAPGLLMSLLFLIQAQHGSRWFLNQLKLYSVFMRFPGGEATAVATGLKESATLKRFSLTHLSLRLPKPQSLYHPDHLFLPAFTAFKSVPFWYLNLKKKRGSFLSLF